MTLCIWPVAPDRNGDGAAQRAWYMLNALAKTGPVDLVILHQMDRPEPADHALNAARGIARSVRFVRVREWRTVSASFPAIPRAVGRLIDQWRLRSVETPRLSRSALAHIASQLPKYADTVFVGRLSTACIVDDLCRAGLLRARRRFVDFDDIMSRFRRLQIHRQIRDTSPPARWWQALIARQMAAAEGRLIREWDGCAVASGDDVDALAAAYSGAQVVHLPNVVERTPAPADNGPPKLLFVGNLTYPPNVDGLRFFLDAVWPVLRRSDPDVGMMVVGRAPEAGLAAEIRRAGMDLHVDVATVAPFYEKAHVVVAPIFFGGGTRVKIVEAMAFGKAIVSTPFGVEGLAVQDGTHVLLGATPEAMVEAIRRLLTDVAFRQTLGENARALQQERYGSGVLDRAVRDTIDALSTGQWDGRPGERTTRPGAPGQRESDHPAWARTPSGGRAGDDEDGWQPVRASAPPLPRPASAIARRAGRPCPALAQTADQGESSHRSCAAPRSSPPVESDGVDRRHRDPPRGDGRPVGQRGSDQSSRWRADGGGYGSTR